MEYSLLRYFDLVGAHSSDLLGEAPKEIPKNLLANIEKVASGILDSLNIYGSDYDTKDGTAVRDYIHIKDLAKGHISALEKIREEAPSLIIYNLGTGRGYSILGVIKTYKNASGRKINYCFVERRQGDVSVCFAAIDEAQKELRWRAEKSLEDMCLDSWHWQQMKISEN